MNDSAHQRRIERWLRFGVAVIVPLTALVGLWLLLSKHHAPIPAQPIDGSARVVAFPAAPGPPSITLAPAPTLPTKGANASTP
jgi:hypothetical protein